MTFNFYLKLNNLYRLYKCIKEENFYTSSGHIAPILVVVVDKSLSPEKQLQPHNQFPFTANKVKEKARVSILHITANVSKNDPRRRYSEGYFHWFFLSVSILAF